MKILSTILLLLFIGSESMIYDFTDQSTRNSWSIVDDVVMGGRSNGNLYLNDNNHGVFEGYVSLENNGGFSSIRHNVSDKDISDYAKFVIRIKGDGKKYQFRAKTNNRDYYSYIGYFETTGDWQTVEIPFNSMEAAYRGRMLNMPPFPGEKLDEIAFLIGNKKEQNFKLEIDYIEVD